MTAAAVPVEYLYESPPDAPDEDEFIETLICPMPDALRMIRDGRIVDSKTALALLLAADYLREKGMTL